ncbi:MAG: TetR/AcrR family transcriptional regulator [Bryobacteraceae bacterium]
MAAPKRTKHDVISEFRCAEILEAARKVFARKGFQNATMDEIAEAAGVAKGTVYLYFESKREVYLEALRRGFAAATEQIERNMEAAPDAAGKIRAFVNTRVRYAEENRDFVAIFHAEFGNLRAACLSKEFRSLYIRQAKALGEVIRAAVERGEVRPVRADAAGFILYEMTRGLITQRLLGCSNRTVEEDIEVLFDVVWKGLAPA